MATFLEMDLSDEERASLLIAQREELFAEAMLINKKFDSINKENYTGYRAHLERIEELDKEFKSLQQYIRLFNVKQKDAKSKIEALQPLTRFMEMITLAKGKYLAFSHLEPVVQACDPNLTANRFQNLPRVQLPTFSGNLEEWSAYYSLYKSLVGDNNLLTEVEKFQYLRSSLRADALAVISDFELSAGNFQPALKALVDRYQNTRRLGSMYLSKITQFKTMKDASYGNLKRFLHVHMNSFNALRSLDIPDLSDFIPLHLALENLDADTRRAFENKYSGSTIPSYKNLIDFVTSRSRVAELLGEDNKSTGREGNISSGPSKQSSSLFHSMGAIPRGEADKGPSSKTETPSRSESKNWERTSISENKYLECWNCGGHHLCSKCPEPRRRFCYRCGKPGEVTASCSSCNPGKGNRG